MAKESKLKSPLDVWCPNCSAAVTAKCTRKAIFGRHLTEDFHQERIDRFNKRKEAGLDEEDFIV